MKTRSQAEIDRQIKELLIDKANIPERSLFGTPNHEIIDVQIQILKGETELEDLDEGDWEDSDETNEIFRKAEEATQWLEGDEDEDLFDLRD